MGDKIDSDLLSMAICFDSCSTKVVQLSNWNPFFYGFWCHHPSITQVVLKIEYVHKINIFGLKMTVKSGLEKIF